MVKLANLVPDGTKDLWQNVPISTISKGGVWVRKRLYKDVNGIWKSTGRLSKKYYRV